MSIIRNSQGGWNPYDVVNTGATRDIFNTGKTKQTTPRKPGLAGELWDNSGYPPSGPNGPFDSGSIRPFDIDAWDRDKTVKLTPPVSREQGPAGEVEVRNTPSGPDGPYRPPTNTNKDFNPFLPDRIYPTGGQSTGPSRENAGGQAVETNGPTFWGNEDAIKPQDINAGKPETAAATPVSENGFSFPKVGAEQTLEAYKNVIKDMGGTEADLAAADAYFNDWERQNAAMEEQKANYQAGMKKYQDSAKAFLNSINRLESDQSEAVKDAAIAWEKVNARGEKAVADSIARTNQHLGKIEALFVEQQNTLEGAKAQSLQSNVQGMLGSMSETEKSIAREYGIKSAEYASFQQAKLQTLAAANSGISAEFAKLSDSQYSNFINTYSNLSAQMSMYTNYHEQMVTGYLADAANANYQNELQYQQFVIGVEQLKQTTAENLTSLLINEPVICVQQADLVAQLATLIPPKEIEVPEIQEDTTAAAALTESTNTTDEAPVTPTEADALAEAKKNLPVLDAKMLKNFETFTPDQLLGLTPEQFASTYLGYRGPFDREVKEHFARLLFAVQDQARKNVALNNQTATASSFSTGGNRNTGGSAANTTKSTSTVKPALPGTNKNNPFTGPKQPNPEYTVNAESGPKPTGTKNPVIPGYPGKSSKTNPYDNVNIYA